MKLTQTQKSWWEKRARKLFGPYARVEFPVKATTPLAVVSLKKHQEGAVLLVHPTLAAAKNKTRLLLLRALEESILAGPQCKISEAPLGAEPLPLRKSTTHDIRALAKKLLSQEFPGLKDVLVFWAHTPVRSTKHGQRRVLGYHLSHPHRVYVSTRLDRDDVPVYVVRDVLRHELLHAAMPTHCFDGVYLHHSRAFRAKMAQSTDRGRSAAWQRAHRDLLKSA